MHPRYVVPLLVGLLLLFTGFRPAALPFVPDSLFSDSVVAHWPNALYLRQSIVEDQTLPLWRETTMAGQPFAANPLNKTAYPLQWLVIVLPPSLHLNLMIITHLLIAGWGMARWAQSLGLRREEVILSAMAFVIAPRMLAHLGAGHIDIVYALAWWPWLMVSVQHNIKQQRPSALYVVQFGLLAGLLFLADVRACLYAFASAGVYAIAESVRSRDWRCFTGLAMSLPLIVLLTLSISMPLLLWSEYTNRGSLSVAEAGSLGFEPLHLLGLILPAHEGSVETLSYLGLPILVLGLIGITGPSLRYWWIWMAASLLIFMFALGDNGPLWSLLADHLSFLRWFRVPSRIWLIPTLIMPLLAGHGLQQLHSWIDGVRESQLPIGLKRVRLSIAASMTVIIIIGLFALLVLPLSASIGVSTLLNGIVLAGVLLIALAGRLSSSSATRLLMLVVILDLLWTGVHWLEWRGQDVWLEPYRPLAERLVELEPHRIYSPTFAVQQQVAEEYNLELFGGVDPFQLTGIVDAISQGSGVSIGLYSPTMPPLNVDDENSIDEANRDAYIDTRILAQWDVSHIVGSYAIDHERLELLDRVDDRWIFANRDFEQNQLVADIRSPNWPLDWPGLPTAETVERINRLTSISAAISGITFILAAAYLGRVSYRRDDYA